MRCTNHPDVPANTLCTRCDRLLCPECVEERNGRAFCSDCAAFVDRRAQERSFRPLAAAAGGVTAES